MSSPRATRRDFVRSIAAAGPAALLTASVDGADVEGANALPDPPPDIAQRTAPTGGDLGSMFVDLSRLADDNEYSLSFLAERFRDLPAFKRAAREKVFQAFLYRPPLVDPRPELLDRADCGDYTREKIVFSTGPRFRVPAYVPKGLSKPAPAIVDLHSHGGRFLFERSASGARCRRRQAGSLQPGVPSARLDPQ